MREAIAVENTGYYSGGVVSLSADGSIVEIGLSVADVNGLDSGHVWVFTSTVVSCNDTRK